MIYPIKVVDIELSKPLPTFEGLDGYMALQGLVRFHGVPIGYIQAPLISGRCTAKTLSKLILDQHSWKIVCQLLENGLSDAPKPEGLQLEDLFQVPPPQYQGSLPLVTVAVCTRDRPDDLALCLDSLTHLDYPHLDILIVDNAPATRLTEELLRTKYPQFRYVCEPRPGLDWARNRAIIEAKGEIVAYTDDDVIVDAGWVKALATTFAEHPEVMVVTGLVVPYELENEPQVLFEMHGGFGKGFERRWYQVEPGQKMPWGWMGAGQFGTGANMAYRRSLFGEIGDFDPAMDVGTVTNGGGDLEMFFRTLQEGHVLVYEPRAIIRHRHRREYEKLRTQLRNNSLGLLSYCYRSVLAYPDTALRFFRLYLWWLVSWNLVRVWIGIKHPTRFPNDLNLAELWGCFPGLFRYPKANRVAKEIATKFGPQTEEPFQKQPALLPLTKRQTAIAVRNLELSEPIKPITDATDYYKVRVFLTWKDRPLCSVELTNPYQFISKTRLIEAIVANVNIKLIKPDLDLPWNQHWHQVCDDLRQHIEPEIINVQNVDKPPTLAPDISVSIILATCDRPNDLRNCLQSLTVTIQNSPRKVELIVVDNNPASGLTAPIVAEFPEIILVNELRKGSSYARNTGFSISTGDICVVTDDDVTVSPYWLEKLIAPFTRADVMIVTGNILPIELETPSQQFFEVYGGLGRGFDRFEVDGKWFESFPRYAVPTWTLGATANSAFRATIFSHPRIGMLYEALGAGMPSGVGEDTYIFYKVLKAGYTLVYEPTAYVWHKHRSDLPALRRQLYSYSKGHVGYHLTTLLQDKDWRSLYQIVVALPMYHTQKIIGRLRRRTDFPISLTLLEIAGNLAGPWSMWQANLRVKREGRSVPYIPVSQRPKVQPPVSETPQYATSDSQSP